MKSIVVFCGANYGYNNVYADVAYEMGSTLAQKGIQIINGGSKLGLMGAVSEGALQQGGKVIGVIPYFLQQKEIVHDALTELILVETMHERKQKMYQLCDAVIALPGGWGTLDELFEMMTWAQLGLHQKPIGILNINGYYEPFIVMLQNMVAEGFVKEDFMSMIVIGNDKEELLDKMMQYQAPSLPVRWLNPNKT